VVKMEQTAFEVLAPIVVEEVASQGWGMLCRTQNVKYPGCLLLMFAKLPY
jgi:hypothetical protein